MSCNQNDITQTAKRFYSSCYWGGPAIGITVFVGLEGQLNILLDRCKNQISDNGLAAKQKKCVIKIKLVVRHR